MYRFTVFTIIFSVLLVLFVVGFIFFKHQAANEAQPVPVKIESSDPVNVK